MAAPLRVAGPVLVKVAVARNKSIAPTVRIVEAIKGTALPKINLVQLHAKLNPIKQAVIPTLKASFPKRKQTIVSAVEEVIPAAGCWLCGETCTQQCAKQASSASTRMINLGRNPFCDLKHFRAASEAAAKDPTSGISFRRFHESFDI